MTNASRTASTKSAITSVPPDDAEVVGDHIKIGMALARDDRFRSLKDFVLKIGAGEGN